MQNEIEIKITDHGHIQHVFVRINGELQGFLGKDMEEVIENIVEFYLTEGANK